MEMLRADGKPETRDFKDSQNLGTQNALMVGLESFAENREKFLAHDGPKGIKLEAQEHPESLADILGELDVVAIHLPHYKDGRAYSYARLLREQYEFKGELWAIGDVLFDQLQFMQRVGFDAFEVPLDKHDLWRSGLSAFTVKYQDL